MNRALGYDLCHGCVGYGFILICIFFGYWIRCNSIFDLYFVADIGSDVIDRIRIDLVLLYFQIYYCNPSSTRSRSRSR